MPSRSIVLAAAATAAVPGLSPAQVQDVPTRPGSPYTTALVTDADGVVWQVRGSRTTAAGATLDQTEQLTGVLAKRVSVALPQTAGTATLLDGATVTVYREMTGEPLPWRALQPRSEEARSLGRVLAQLHDLDPRLYDEAGLPSYDADGYRSRRLAELDRAASTGHVPAALLGRWERALEEVSLWRFATTPTHGGLNDGDVRVAEGEVVALDGWQGAAVTDPATDFAVLMLAASPEAVDTVVESYAQSRRERPDTHLERRIRLAAELHRVRDLMDAIATDEDLLIERRAVALRRLEESTQGDESLLPPPVVRRTSGASAGTPPEPSVDPADIEVIDVRESDDEDETLEIPQVDDGESEDADADADATDGDATDADDDRADDAPDIRREPRGPVGPGPQGRRGPDAHTG